MLRFYCFLTGGIVVVTVMKQTKRWRRILFYRMWLPCQSAWLPVKSYGYQSDRMVTSQIAWLPVRAHGYLSERMVTSTKLLQRSVNFHRISMRPQHHPFPCLQEAFLSYKFLCGSGILGGSWAAGGPNRCFGSTRGCRSASSQFFATGQQRNPFPYPQNPFSSYNFLCGSGIW